MIKVLRKCKTAIRLTIAHDGKVRLKIPMHYPDAEADKIEARAMEVVKEKGPQEKTLRIRLQADEIL